MRLMHSERYYLNPRIDEFSYASKDEKKALEFLDNLFDALPAEKQEEIKEIVLKGVEKNDQQLIAKGIEMTMEEWASLHC